MIARFQNSIWEHHQIDTAVVIFTPPENPMRILLILLLLAGAVAGQSAEPTTRSNRLSKESSPYLLQHAHNPVDWYPWGPEAFARAKKEGKLIFLSIGYSSCHWCHVMERESFSSPAVAEILNKEFICIKVDREERPDVDDVYMTALNVLGYGGGWPLSMFLTAEGKPIFGGTYWPPDDREVDGETIPGFKSILKRVVGLRDERGEELQSQAEAVAQRTADAMNRASRAVALVPLNQELVREVVESYDLDPEHGGIGLKIAQFRGTKFPRVAVLQFLLHQSRNGPPELRQQVFLTLDKMADGGIYDHLGGGFHRYSTERTWTIPHFEKMLYDNAQLIELYSEAYRLDPQPRYRRVIAETVNFVQRELTAPAGGFYSALDADTEGEEGRYYIWTSKELETILGDSPEAKLFRKVYSLDQPNFEGKYHILRRSANWSRIAAEEKLTEVELLDRLAPLRQKLLQARAKRERPFLDTKILTGWNGQMIGGLAKAGEVLKQPEYLKRAETAAEFLLKQLRSADGRLLRVYAAVPGQPAQARGPAFLEDYSYLVHGLLNLHDATGQKRWLQEAQSLTEQMIRWYGDEPRGGFFTTASDGEKLFARGKDYHDGAQPSANGVATRNLTRLWKKTGEDRYRQAAEQSVRQFAGIFRLNPSSAPQLAGSLATLLAETGGLRGDLPSRPDPAPTAPKQSADVVKVRLSAKQPVPGRQRITATLTVTAPWHIYAQPPENPELTASATRIEVFRGKTRLNTTVDFPRGEPARDAVAGEYRVYRGEVTIPIEIPVANDAVNANDKVEVRIRVIACQAGRCLLPSTIRATVP